MVSLETAASYASTLVSAKVYTKKEGNKATDIESRPHWGEYTSSTHNSDHEEDNFNEETESFPEGGLQASLGGHVWLLLRSGCMLWIIEFNGSPRKSPAGQPIS